MSVTNEKRKRALELALSQRRMLTALFFALSGLAGTAVLLHHLAAAPPGAATGSRHPSSLQEADSDFDPDLYADDSIEDLERATQAEAAKSNSAKTRSKAVFPFEPVSQRSENLAALAAQRTGVSGRRAREVVLHPEAFSETSDEYKIRLNLFEDVSPMVLMQRPSLYGVNHAFLVGQIIGDPSSRVQLMMADGQMNGTVQTHQATYRIVSLGSGRHFVIELDSPRAKH